MQTTINRLAQAIIAKEPQAKISTSSAQHVQFPELGMVHHVVDLHCEIPGKDKKSWAIVQARAFGHNGYRAIQYHQLQGR